MTMEQLNLLQNNISENAHTQSDTKSTTFEYSGFFCLGIEFLKKEQNVSFFFVTQ